MKRVRDEIEANKQAYGRTAFFSYLRDPAIDTRSKLGFAPHVAHFAMTFGDLCTLVLKQEPATDEYQQLVNTHAREDEGHWRWYLEDLVLLGEDRELRYSHAIRQIWSAGTVRMRRLSYQLCGLALGGDSLRRLVLVQCIEGAFQVTLAGLMPVASELARRTGKVLTYMGPGHSDVETSHVMEDPELLRKLVGVPLEPEVARELCTVVKQCFGLFSDFSDELLDLSRAATSDG
jgi:hypothetical protein